MTDCSNVEIRDLLPELLHGALPPAVRARVEAHVATCTNCADELAVLRSARGVLSAGPVPVVDAASIVAALPRPVSARAVPTARQAPRRSSTFFRLAAAISFISLGGISVAVARSYLGDVTPFAVDSAVGIGDTAGSVTPESAVDRGPDAVAAPERLAVHPVVGTLDDADLQSLLDELELLEAAPLAEPETTPGGRAVASAIIGS
jgi:anti-sigma factor RsiW